MHFDDLPESTKTKYPELKELYPNGIEFNEKGFPIFTPYAVKRVEINYNQNHKNDIRDANKLAGITSEPKGYVWHHHEDGKTMELIPRNLHDGFKHTGGRAHYRDNLNFKEE